MKMKVQDSDIILGLKDTISNLTKLVQDKEQNYQELKEKYDQISKEQQESLQSKVTNFHQESIAES